MRIPVLALLPKQEAFVNLAQAFSAVLLPGEWSPTADLPKGLDIDRQFTPVPVGTGVAATNTIQSLSPSRSEQFAVRGFIEVSDGTSVPDSIDGQPIYIDPEISPILTCSGTAALGTEEEVRQKLDVSKLHDRNLDGSGVAIAIVDTGINLPHLTKKLNRPILLDAANSGYVQGISTPPGGYPVDHGTMCAYDALIAAPKATLLDYPIVSGSSPGSTLVGRRLSLALSAFSQLLAFWGVAFAAGGEQKYRALVINNSWGVFHDSWDFPAGHPGRYIDNPRHPFNVLVEALCNANADVLFAAGNCGDECPDPRCKGRTAQSIMGANALSCVLTVSGCDIENVRVGYSSRGPSIEGMYQEKPDVTCYTHFRGSEAFGSGSPDEGTSAACPVAAGCIAALRSGVSPSTTPPRDLFTQIKATSRKSGQPGWDSSYGFGILNPSATAQSVGVG